MCGNCEVRIIYNNNMFQLPEVEVNDLPDDPLSYQLVHTQPDKHPKYPITLKAHAAQAKPNWLQEIRQYTKDASEYPKLLQCIMFRVF